MIETVETDPVSPFGEPEVPPAEWTYRACVRNWLEKGPSYVGAILGRISQNAGREYRGIRPFPRGQSLERTVAAYVNHGRWLWSCPICNEAQVCSDADARAFCVGCFNGGDGWWEVDWPAERVEIETLLARRPKRSQRNWEPGELVEQLQAENLSIGVDPDLPQRRWPGAEQALQLVREQLGLPAGEASPRMALEA